MRLSAYVLGRDVAVLESAGDFLIAATFGVPVKAQVDIVEAISDAVSDIALGCEKR
jgi:hypothetical protein